jgi:hypothetical protein
VKKGLEEGGGGESPPEFTPRSVTDRGDSGSGGSSISISCARALVVQPGSSSIDRPPVASALHIVGVGRDRERGRREGNDGGIGVGASRMTG